MCYDKTSKSSDVHTIRATLEQAEFAKKKNNFLHTCSCSWPRVRLFWVLKKRSPTSPSVVHYNSRLNLSECKLRAREFIRSTCISCIFSREMKKEAIFKRRAVKSTEYLWKFYALLFSFWYLVINILLMVCRVFSFFQLSMKRVENESTISTQSRVRVAQSIK